MSDHADVVRATLSSPWRDGWRDAVAALDALVAERETAIDIMRAALGRADDAEARVTELEAALQSVEDCGDLAAVRIARAALAKEGT